MTDSSKIKSVKGQKQQPININPYEIRADRSEDENLEEFAEVYEHIKDKLIILLGAGASIGAMAGTPPSPIPTAAHLRDEIWKRYMLPPNSPDYDFNQLAAVSLDQASAFAETKVGRAEIASFIANRFQTDLPLWQHVVLKYLNPKAFFTTNYDLLIEQGWDSHNRKKPMVTIFAEDQKYNATQIPLFKPHGSADRAMDAVGSGGPVITTIDYFDMLTKKQTMLRKWLDEAENACVLLIGYSMSDMDIGSYLYTLRQTGGTHWYSVFPRTERTVRKYWTERLRIRPIDRRFSEFMHDLDERINFIPATWKYDQISQLQKQGIIQ